MYERGYVLTGTNNSVEGWNKVKVNDLTAWVHPLLNFYIHKENDTVFLLMGTVIDPLNKDGNSQNIIKILSKKFAYSEDRFFDYLDELSGRFVLLISNKDKCYILQDATGNKSLFYDTEFNYFSSHPELIIEFMGEHYHNQSKDYIADSNFHRKGSLFPGLLTTYKNIKKGLPNTLINVNLGRIERFFPRESLPTKKVNSFLIEEISQLLTNQVSILSNEYKLSQSLTAGLDSRVTLAASKDFKDEIYYYTIQAWHEHQKEIKVVKDLCETLGIKHHVLTGELSEIFLKSHLKNTSSMSSADRGLLAQILLDSYPQDRLHLKSNVSEIGRAFYSGTRAFLPSMPNAEHLARLYMYESKSDFVVNAFQDYIDTLDFNKKRLMNYDPFDMFYWEFRMGGWQAMGLLECDVAQDSFILFNNRHILKSMLSIPITDRRRATLHHELINHMWPETLAVGINPWVTHSRIDDAKRIIRGLMYRVG